MTPSIDTVNLFLRATSSANADVDAATQLMTEDVQFIGPLMRTSGRAEYAALLRQFLPAHVDTRVLRQFSDGDEVCSIDQPWSARPAAPRSPLRWPSGSGCATGASPSTASTTIRASSPPRSA